MPEWALFVVFAGGVALVSVAVLLVVRRRLPAWRDSESSQVVVGVSAMVMTFFALVIAFAVVTLDGSRSDASRNVRDEASSLSQIVHDMRVFSPADRRRVDAAVAAYIHEVRAREFHAMRDGKIDRRSAVLIDRLFTTVQLIEPSSHAQRTFYDSAITALNAAVNARQSRLATASSALPGAFWILIVLTAIVSIATTFFLKTEAVGLEVLMVSAVAVVVGAGMLTTLLLEYPFSGSVAVSSSPFVQGVLGQLPGAGP